MILEHRLIGHGPQKVLVLHGWFGDENFLAPMLPSLDGEGFSYCCVAYRGYGASRGLKGSFTLEEIAADALDTAGSLGWTDFDVVGHSMGGKVAQLVMLQAPQRVRRIVAVTPVPAVAVPFDDAGWALFSGAAVDIGKRQAIINFSTGKRLSPRWVERLAAKSWAHSTPEAFAAYLDAWARTDFAARVQGATTPLLAIVGEHDPSLNTDVMRATYLTWFSESTLQVLANAGHYPMDETPVALATAIERFLQA